MEIVEIEVSLFMYLYSITRMHICKLGISRCETLRDGANTWKYAQVIMERQILGIEVNAEINWMRPHTKMECSSLIKKKKKTFQ